MQRSKHVVLLFCTTLAYAAPPDKVPPACRAQVENAVKQLEPCLASPSRKLAKGSPGTIENAIMAYAPPHWLAVDEGTLPAPRTSVHCPSGMAMVASRFCVDKWEGSLLEKQSDGSTQLWSPYETPLDGHVYVAQTVANVVPQAYISAAQSEAACKEAGKRLCAPVEWRAACGGSQGYAFPYGPTRIKNKCRDSGTAPMLVFHADTAKRGWGMSELNDDRLNQLDNTVAKTGAYTECVNDYGVYDMVGNLHEWTADPNGTFQGGYYLDTSEHGDGCAYRTIAHHFKYHDYSNGFRCCADMVPD
jgi:hypothetical protein